MENNFIFSLFLCLCICCNNRENSLEKSSLKNIYIDLTDLENEKPLEEYIDDVSFIPLQTTDSCFLQWFSSIKIVDGKIYISDPSQKCVFVFDEKGKYLFKIDRLGRGPDEYSQLLGLCVDERYIIVSGVCELVLYNKDNGGFVKKIRISPNDFIPANLSVDSSFYYFQTADGFPANKMQASVLVFDKEEFAFRKGYIDPFFFKERPYNSSTVFIHSPYGILFHQALNDTLYCLGEDGLEPLFFLNVGKHQFTYDMYEKASLTSDGKKMIPNKAVYPIDDICFTDEYLCFTCYQRTGDPAISNIFWCFYLLESGKVKIFNEKKLYDKNKYYVNFLAFDAVDEDGYFYIKCYPSLITYFRDEKKEMLDERYKSMQAEDNFWIMKYRLKL